MVFNHNGEQTYVYQGDIKSWTQEDIHQFINNAFDGKIEPWLLSEDPVDNTDNDVKVVVAKNYKENVYDPTKDVFIWYFEYLHPRHQEFITTIFEPLAQEMK